jgi:DNA-binding LacI/PurR family transcriptional regulator
VDEATRERLLAAMRRVDYRLDSAARALRNGRFHSIGPRRGGDLAPA